MPRTDWIKFHDPHGNSTSMQHILPVRRVVNDRPVWSHICVENAGGRPVLSDVRLLQRGGRIVVEHDRHRRRETASARPATKQRHSKKQSKKSSRKASTGKKHHHVSFEGVGRVSKPRRGLGVMV